MTMTKIALPAALMMALTACVDGGAAAVNKAPTGISSCGNVGGVSAQYLQGASVRCGPQAELPYTLR